MIKLAAPYPSAQTITLLPNPEFSDSENLTATVLQHRSMNGKLFTYVKAKNDKKRLLFRFQLNRMKALELRAFIQSYYKSIIRVTDHNDISWVVTMMNNPFEFESKSDEQQVIQLEFEECEI